MLCLLCTRQALHSVQLRQVVSCARLLCTCSVSSWVNSEPYHDLSLMCFVCHTLRHSHVQPEMREIMEVRDSILSAAGRDMHNPVRLQDQMAAKLSRSGMVRCLLCLSTLLALIMHSRSVQMHCFPLMQGCRLFLPYFYLHRCKMQLFIFISLLISLAGP